MERLKQLREKVREQELDAILINQAENRRYLSGFTGSAGWLIITASQAILATDFRYYEQMAQQAPDFELAKITGKLSDLLPGWLEELGIKRLGFESQHLTVDNWQTLSQATEDVEWVPLKKAVEDIRAFKDEAEIQALAKSVALTDAAFAHLVEFLEPGMTELQAAWEIESYMRSHGASGVAFSPIVGSGPNGALPHARPTDRIIEDGDPIVIDIGCVLDGYCSDMTRTVCLGTPSDKYLEVWNIVLEAQEKAVVAIKSGTAGTEADAAARSVIEEAGYGEYFGHGLGHGVGLAVHESPGAGKLSEDILQAGMSLTIEPGIYLPGEFGVRIEDLVMIEEDGIRTLTGTPKSPVIG
jgi:Xaa-Pro aminopeptidase